MGNETMKKFVLTGGLLLSTLMVANGCLGGSEARAETTNGQVTFNGGSITIDPDKPTDPSDPSAGTILLLPTTLNFGSTAISYNADTNLKATTDGNQSSPVTTGAIRIEDMRGTNAGWVVKVNQTQFKNGTNELTGAEISITTGQATNVGGTIPTGGEINKKTTLTPGTEMELFKANTTEGNGISELPLNQFDLMVPAATAKTAGQYTTTITWTVSETI
ncbi:WxL domain-containing protein [Enterococcus faecalis]|nr:WxL domain-containing protein [Enterococcus faecalis]